MRAAKMMNSPPCGRTPATGTAPDDSVTPGTYPACPDGKVRAAGGSASMRCRPLSSAPRYRRLVAAPSDGAGGGGLGELGAVRRHCPPQPAGEIEAVAGNLAGA